MGNGHWESTRFNSRLQPVQIALGTLQNGYDKLKLEYAYGEWESGSLNSAKNNGNIGRQIITVPNGGSTVVFTQKYEYDSLNRLKDATETSGGDQTWRQAFTYDRYGNRTFHEGDTTTLTKGCGGLNPTVCTPDRKVENPSISGSTNRIVQDQDGDSADDYTFDSAGNTTKQATGMTFIYDGENKQVEAKNASNATIGQYWYDGDGKRVKKYVPATGEITIFVYDASRLLVAEYSTILNPTPQVSYLTTDNLGSPRINTDQNGAVIARHDYHPFGEDISTDQRTTTMGYIADDIRKQFTSYERDNETDLDFADDRFYSSKIGRFMSTDNILLSRLRINNPQIWNSYSYVGNNPLAFVDPNGMERIELGQKEADIKKDIKDAKARKKALQTSNDNLKKQKDSLKPEDYESQKAAINSQIEAEEKTLSTLETKLAGTIMVNAILAKLAERNLQNGLKLEDFSLSTDPNQDFGISVDEDNVNAFVLQGPISPLYGGEIFINTQGPLYQGAVNGNGESTKQDWILLGAATFRHEQWHRDGPTRADRISEKIAYGISYSILLRYEHDFSPDSSLFAKRKAYFSQRMNAK